MKFPFSVYFTSIFNKSLNTKHDEILQEKFYNAKVAHMEKTAAKFNADAALASATQYLNYLQELMDEAKEDAANGIGIDTFRERHRSQL